MSSRVGSPSTLHTVAPGAAPATRILRRDEDGSHARALFQRYRRLFIGQNVVRAILGLQAGQHDAAAAERAFSCLRDAWETQGGFLETISPENIGTWISSDAFIVAEAADPERAATGTFTPVADCILRLPDRGWAVPKLTQPRDEVFDPDLYQAIVEDGPAAAAMIDFLGVLPAWSDKKLAGAARHAGMLELIRLNSRRSAAQQIRHVVGMTFVVRGLEILDPEERQRLGPVIRLADLGQAEVVNRASLRAIASSKRCPARPVGRWSSAPPVPIVVAGRPYGLQVHWLCHVRSVADICS